jgi:hypothetical protein
MGKEMPDLTAHRKAMTTRRFHIAAVALAGTLYGCAGANGAAAGPSGSTRPQADDSAAVAAALGFFVARTEGVLQVEPRPLRANASLQGIAQRDLDTDEGLIQARTVFLTRRGIRATDAAADMRCAFSRGVLPPDSLLRLEPDSIRSHRQACLARGLYTTYAFGRAQPAGTPGSLRTLRMRVYRITTWSFEVWDVDLRPNERGYDVIGARRLGGVAS